jgi:hypothetical protein
LEGYTLDLLPEINAPLKFNSSFKKREVVNLSNIDIAFISFDDLLTDKKANPRPKDLRDIENLKNNKSEVD